MGPALPFQPRLQGGPDTHAEVANRFTNFYEQNRCYFHGLCDPHDMDDIDVLVKDRGQKQDRFLKAVARIPE